MNSLERPWLINSQPPGLFSGCNMPAKPRALKIAAAGAHVSPRRNGMNVADTTIIAATPGRIAATRIVCTVRKACRYRSGSVWRRESVGSITLARGLVTCRSGTRRSL